MSKTSADIFATTRWSAVLAAGRPDQADSRRALAELCETYWYPLYVYARRRGSNPHDAEDVVQGFFERLLELDSLAEVTPEKGKFRAFLLASMNNYLARRHAYDTAEKRCTLRTVSLEAETAERRLQMEPLDDATPERIFERQWALTLLERVVQRLFAEYEASGRGPLFLALRASITPGEDLAGYAEVAASLGLSEEALRVAIHRLRQRYRTLLREEIARTVASEAEVREELAHLRQAIS